WNMKQAGQRWEVFRIGPWSHNILTLDNRAPSIHQRVELGDSWEKGVEVDVQMPYWDALRTHLRRVWLDEKDDLVVEDILEGGDSLHVIRWALCSEAEARIADNRTVLLTRNGHTRQLQAELTGPQAGALEAALHPVTWEEGMDPETTHLHDYDAENPGFSLTSFSFTLKPHEKVTLRVRLVKIR
ncbi:MAG: heparinase II/III family protein, partial [Bacteroidales bacterium]|nr:heparinase II/III family protein [Bacteroidales bacterium]